MITNYKTLEGIQRAGKRTILSTNAITSSSTVQTLPSVPEGANYALIAVTGSAVTLTVGSTGASYPVGTFEIFGAEALNKVRVTGSGGVVNITYYHEF
jgi:hypothetical protein